MRFRTVLQTTALAAAMFPLTTLAAAPDAQVGTKVAPAQIFTGMLQDEAKEFIGAAEAMPADKFNFAPPAGAGKFDGVRTFAAEVKHVTEANYGLFRGFNVPGAKSRDEIEKLTDRDQILAALKDSFNYADKALGTITAENAFVAMDAHGTTRAAVAIHAVSHPQDHYGQMVEYLRMNGIVPPASRK